MKPNQFIGSRSAIRAGLAVTLIAYAGIAWFVIDTAIALHKPCVSDFEGGCGYGKVWAGVFSWMAAWAAMGPAVIVGAFSRFIPRFKRLLIATALALAVPPAGYVLYGLYAVVPVVLELLK